MVAAAVQGLVLVEVDQVHQQLLAHGAGEAGGVPGLVGPGPAGRHTDVATVQGFLALK